MKIRQLYSGCILIMFLALLFSCAPASPPAPGQEPRSNQEMDNPAPQIEPAVLEQNALQQPGQLPVRFQQPAYLVKEMRESADLGFGDDEEIDIPVGADISTTTGPVTLRDILKRLAVLKNMNISWASDVDQFALVDVDIRAEDDFFTAIDNILRQMDYFHVVQNNTIVVKYRETRKFHVAMPFTASTYDSAVGGDVLGATGAAGEGSSAMVGNIKITSNENKFDIWGNIRENLDQILEIWEETVPAPTEGGEAQEGDEPPPTTTRRNVQAGKGYYTIDKPIGLITVTAPRPLIEKIEDYLNSLKKELYRQISIEAKILEVTKTEGFNINLYITNNIGPVEALF